MKVFIAAVLVGVANAALDIPEIPANATEAETCSNATKDARAATVTEIQALTETYEQAELAFLGIKTVFSQNRDDFNAQKKGKKGAALKEVITAQRASESAVNKKKLAADKARKTAKKNLDRAVNKANKAYAGYTNACPLDSCETGIELLKIADEKITKYQNNVELLRAGTKDCGEFHG